MNGRLGLLGRPEAVQVSLSMTLGRSMTDAMVPADLSRPKANRPQPTALQQPEAFQKPLRPVSRLTDCPAHPHSISTSLEKLARSDSGMPLENKAPIDPLTIQEAPACVCSMNEPCEYTGCGHSSPFKSPSCERSQTFFVLRMKSRAVFSKSVFQFE